MIGETLVERIVKYEITTAYVLSVLRDNIQLAIQGGWEPFGAPFRDREITGEDVWRQVIVKRGMVER